MISSMALRSKSLCCVSGVAAGDGAG